MGASGRGLFKRDGAAPRIIVPAAIAGGVAFYFMGLVPALVAGLVVLVASILRELVPSGEDGQGTSEASSVDHGVGPGIDNSSVDNSGDYY